jgi:hypothetical protein
MFSSDLNNNRNRLINRKRVEKSFFSQKSIRVRVEINWNVFEFHTLIVSSHEPETIFSFEGIIANHVKIQ